MFGLKVDIKDADVGGISKLRVSYPELDSTV
jgi:hypothetical protein